MRLFESKSECQFQWRNKKNKNKKKKQGSIIEFNLSFTFCQTC